MTSGDLSLGEKLGSMQSEIKACTEAIRALTAGVGERVQEHGERLSSLGMEISDMKTGNDRLYRKIDGHIKNHWKWVGTVTGITAVIAAIKGMK